MEIYFFLFFFFFFFSFWGLGKKSSFLVVFLLSIILGFRSERIGIDTSTYIEYYDSLSLDIFSGYMEKGFNLVAVICKFFNLSAYGFNFVVALMTLFPYYYIITRFGNEKINGYGLFFLYSLGFYFLMFNGIRQFLAMSFILLGYDRLDRGKMAAFIMLVIIASFIHLSSLSAFLMIIITRMKLTLKKVFVLLLVSYVIGVLANENFLGSIAGRYASHVDNFGLRDNMLYSLTIGLLSNLFFFWLFRCDSSLSDNNWIKFNVLSIVVLNLMSNLVMGPRLVYIFSITSIVAMSLYMNSNKLNKLVKSIAYLYATITFARFIIPELLSSGLDGSLVPYEIEFHIFNS